MNSQTVYRLEALVELAHAFPRSIPVAQLAARRGIPRAFLARLLTELARLGVVRTLRGPHGGVTLARSPAEISLSELLPVESRPRLGGAAVRRVSAALEEAHRAVLGTLTLASLTEEERRCNGTVDFEI